MRRGTSDEGRGRSSSRGRGSCNRGKTQGAKKRESPQEQPKSKLTSGGNRHKPSHTEIDMGPFSARQAKRVKWSTLARRPQLNRVHTVNVNVSDTPGYVQNFAGKSLNSSQWSGPSVSPAAETRSRVGQGSTAAHWKQCAASVRDAGDLDKVSCSAAVLRPFTAFSPDSRPTEAASGNLSVVVEASAEYWHEVLSSSRRALNGKGMHQKDVGPILNESVGISVHVTVGFLQVHWKTTETSACGLLRIQLPSVARSKEYAVLADDTVAVSTIHPAPEIHEQFTVQKSYGTLCISSCTISTILRPL